MRVPKHTLLLIPYQLGRVALSLLMVFPYLQWKTWTAKRAFRRELIRNGIPRELANNLADAYNSGNKNILRAVTRLH